MVGHKDKAYTRMKAQALKKTLSKSRNATNTKTHKTGKTHATIIAGNASGATLLNS